MNSVMFAALCLKRSVPDIAGSHFTISDSIKSIAKHHLTRTHTHAQALNPHSLRSTSQHGVIILNLITAGAV